MGLKLDHEPQGTPKAAAAFPIRQPVCASAVPLNTTIDTPQRTLDGNDEECHIQHPPILAMDLIRSDVGTRPFPV